MSDVPANDRLSTSPLRWTQWRRCDSLRIGRAVQIFVTCTAGLLSLAVVTQQSVGQAVLLLTLFAVWWALMRPTDEVRHATLGLAVGLLCIGLFGELRVLTTTALALAMTSRLPLARQVVMCVAALAWFPSTGGMAYEIGVPEWLARTSLLAVAGLTWRSRRGEAAGSLLFEPKFWNTTGVRHGVVAVLLVGTSVVTFLALTPVEELPRWDIAHNGLLYRSEDVPLGKVDAAHLASVDVLKRRVAVPAGMFDLLVINGANDRHSVHDPAYCHTGDGWEVTQRQVLPISGGEAAWVRYARGDESTECVYWFTNRVARSPSTVWYWWNATIRRLTGRRTGAEPVLVVLTPVGESSPDWRQLIEQFPPLQTL